MDKRKKKKKRGKGETGLSLSEQAGQAKNINLGVCVCVCVCVCVWGGGGGGHSQFQRIHTVQAKRKRLSYLVGNLVATNWPIYRESMCMQLVITKFQLNSPIS